MRTSIPLCVASLALFTACGSATPSTTTPTPSSSVVAAAPAVQPEAPYPRVTALPAAPRAVVDIDLAALRPTPIFTRLLAIMDGSSPEDVVGLRVLERAERIRFAFYEEDRSLVLIATGPLEGLLRDVMAEMSQRGERPTSLLRHGFTVHMLADDMAAVETSPDTLVLAYPQHLDEVLSVASGQAPSVPLPPEMRALEERPAFRSAPMTMRFLASRELPSSEGFVTLVREGGAGGAAGIIEGDEVRVTGAARVPSPGRAAQLASEVERATRATVDGDVGSATLGEALRRASVRADGQWVELEARFPHTDLESFLGILGSLAGL